MIDTGWTSGPVPPSLELAAYHLHRHVAGLVSATLSWEHLTSGQRDTFRAAAVRAARAMDVTAKRAALEVAAGSVYGGSLRFASSAQRNSARFTAKDAVRAYERHLEVGIEADDLEVLSLQSEEQAAHVEQMRAQAVTDDEGETAQARARRDNDAMTGEGRY